MCIYDYTYQGFDIQIFPLTELEESKHLASEMETQIREAAREREELAAARQEAERLRQEAELSKQMEHEERIEKVRRRSL